MTADVTDIDSLGGSQLTVETSLIFNNGSVIVVGDPVEKIREPGHGVAAWKHTSSVR